MPTNPQPITANKLRHGCIVLFALGFSATLSAQTWLAPVRIVEKIEETGNTGYYSKLIVVNGNPAIAYYDLTHSALAYVRATNTTGTAWDKVVFVDSVGEVGKHVSLQIVNGNPAITYYDETNGNLKYVRANNVSGTAWGLPIAIDEIGDVGKFTSMQVVNEIPAVSYHDETNGNLKYVRATNKSGTLWGLPITIDATGTVGEFTSLQIVNANPAIAYYDRTNGNLKYIRATEALGVNWNTPETFFSVGADAGRYPSLEIVNGNPAIAYFDNTNNNLLFVRSANVSGTAWGSPEILDAPGNVGLHTSLQVINGNPAVSYYDATNDNLKYIRATNLSGTAWDTPVAVDATGIVGQYSSLQLVDGHPAISYFDATTEKLKFVRASNATGSLWFSVPFIFNIVADNVGSYISLQIVAGNPAVSYLDGTNGKLKYVRATHASGASWATPLTLDSTGSVGGYISLQVVNGHPAISYYDYTNGDLKYVRANDAAGTSWGTPVIVDLAGNVGQFTSLQVVNGNPAIAYYDVTNSKLKYARAFDPDGLAWTVVGTVTISSAKGEGVSLQVVNGHPAIAFYLYDGTVDYLKYVRANDAFGSTWPLPQTIEAVYFGATPSLRVVEGHPAIAYAEFDFRVVQNEERYVRATDVSGGLWGTPVILSTTNTAPPSLQTVNGKPAVFFDGKYTKSLNAAGTAWEPPSPIDPRIVSYNSMVATTSGVAIAYYVPAERTPFFLFGKLSLATDFFRTRQSGNWNDPATWESSTDNVDWYAASASPDLNANTITILATHTVTVTADVVADQVVINSGGRISVNPAISFTVK